MTKILARSDVVITTAQVFGRKAPRIITQAMLEKMSPGSIIVDMAVESGGNVEGSQLNTAVEIPGGQNPGLGQSRRARPGPRQSDVREQYHEPREPFLG